MFYKLFKKEEGDQYDLENDLLENTNYFKVLCNIVTFSHVDNQIMQNTLGGEIKYYANDIFYSIK